MMMMMMNSVVLKQQALLLYLSVFWPKKGLQIGGGEPFVESVVR